MKVMTNKLNKLENKSQQNCLIKEVGLEEKKLLEGKNLNKNWKEGNKNNSCIHAED